MATLNDALAGYAQWLGHGQAGRSQRWIDRLEVNRPEIDLFRSQPLPTEPAYVAAPTPLLQPTGTLQASTQKKPLTAEEALKRAHEQRGLNAFTALAAQAPVAQPGYLQGMPIAVKDLIQVQGFRFTRGSGAAADVASQDAEVVARIKRHGGVVIGTANLHELAYGITSDNPHFGRVGNPVAPGRIAGGSSGGSAAAIAAGLATAAVGTCTAGSIRVPAACCGVVGFKPTYDAVPRTGVHDLAPSLDHVGPMAADVQDCAALFAAMLDLSAIPGWRIESLAGLRVARLTGYFEQPLDEEVQQVLQDAVQAAARDGATIDSVKVDGAELAPAIQFQTICAEATAIDWERLQTMPETLGEDVRARLEIGNFLPGHWYVKAQRLRTRLVAAIDAAFDAADILLCPTLRTPAPAVGAASVRIGGQEYPLHTAVTQLTLPFNLSGLPALSLPWSMSREQVPIAVQIIGRRGADWQVLAVAERLQQLAPWRAQGGLACFAGNPEGETHAGN